MSIEVGSDGAVPRYRGSMILEGRDGELRRTSAGFRRPVHHAHHDVELNLIIRGTASYAMDGGSYALKPGTAIWILPDKVHRLTRGPTLEMWVVMFRSELFDPAWLEDLRAQPSRQVSSQELLSLDHLFSEVAQDSDEETTYNAGIRYVLMRALRASHERPAASMRPMHPAVGRAVRLLREDAGGASLSELASAAGVTPHYLSRLLTEQTGRNFVDWRNRVRLDRFIEGYRPGANLLDAALAAGFGSYSRFHHTFTELIGCTPKEWVSGVEAGKLTPKADAASLQGGYGLPGGSSLLSARQPWNALARLASPRIRDVVGDHFFQRLVEALPTEHGPDWRASDDQPLTIAPEEIADLVASFRHQDPDLASEYGRLVNAKDAMGLYQRMCANYLIPPNSVLTSIIVLTAFAWFLGRSNMTPPSPDVLRRQFKGALPRTHRPSRQALRQCHVAAVCHFAVLYEGQVAASSGAGPRASQQLVQAVSQWSEAVFDGDIRLLELRNECLVPPIAAGNSSRAKALAPPV
jgi:AraC-like DNA-binding protein